MTSYTINGNQFILMQRKATLCWLFCASESTGITLVASMKRYGRLKNINIGAKAPVVMLSVLKTGQRLCSSLFCVSNSLLEFVESPHFLFLNLMQNLVEAEKLNVAVLKKASRTKRKIWAKIYTYLANETYFVKETKEIDWQWSTVNQDAEHNVLLRGKKTYEITLKK